MQQAHDDNWLNSSVFSCPHCKAQLYRVNHSPMADDFRLYCDQCPKSVEVGFYDQTLNDIQKNLPTKTRREQIIAEVVQRLRPCDCGGRFDDKSSRRCFQCGQVVIAGDPAGVDLYPYIGAEDQSREPTEAEQAVYDEFLHKFIRTENLWL